MPPWPRGAVVVVLTDRTGTTFPHRLGCLLLGALTSKELPAGIDRMGGVYKGGARFLHLSTTLSTNLCTTAESAT